MGDHKIYNIGTIETAQFFNQSLDYQQLVERIDDKQELVEYYQATGKTDRALKAGVELEALAQQMEQLKENVLRLYEIFTRIDIGSERLAQAKAHFERGAFREADAVLNAEAMGQDLERLIARGEQLDQEKAEIDQSRGQIADEFLIKARLWTTFYEQADWFEQSCAFFEAALRAARTAEGLFEFALFSQKHNRLQQAEALYGEALQMYRALAEENPRTYLPDVAMTLNNLANLQSDQNELTLAQQTYGEALQIRRALAEENPRTYLPDVAMTLVNLSIFYLQAIPNRDRSITLAQEAIAICQQFPGIPTVERYAAIALQVLQAHGDGESDVED